MNEQKQIEAMARLDGYSIVKVVQGIKYWKHEAVGMFAGNKFLPDYTSHDAVQRVIDGLVYGEKSEYISRLLDLTKVIMRTTENMISATPAQKVEAILKAKGEWE